MNISTEGSERTKPGKEESVDPTAAFYMFPFRIIIRVNTASRIAV